MRSPLFFVYALRMPETTTESPPEYHGALGDKVKISKWWLWKEMLGYEPHEEQRKFHSSNAQHRFWYGPKRLGKTTAVAAEIVPILLTPGSRSWLIGARYENVVREWETIHDWVVHDIGVKNVKRAVCNPRQGDISLELILEDPVTHDHVLSFVQGKSGRERESLQSEELDAAVLCEMNYINEGVWTREVRPRLMTRGGISLGACAPHGTTNWVHRAYQKWTDGMLPNYEFFGMGVEATANPFNEESIDPFEMTEAEYSEVVRGIPTPKAGRIYRSFPTIIEDSRPPDGLHFVGVDFGFVHPFAAVFCTVQDENLIVWKTYKRTKRTIDKHSDKIKKILGKREIEGAVCDPAGAGDKRVLRERLGWPMKRAKKDVIDGIQAVTLLAEQGRLLVMEQCKDLIAEWQSYEWQEDRYGFAKEVPRKENDDLLDALRYVVYWLKRRRYL